MTIHTLLKKIIINIALPLFHKGIVLRLRYKKQINITFIAMSLTMWRYQDLYELLYKHPRFNASILILPCIQWAKEQQDKDRIELLEYFQEKGIKPILGVKDDGTHIDLRNELKPDILFYPQPYIGNFHEEFDIPNFFDRLLCYYPYAFWRAKDDWSYNLPFHNKAWKLFYSTELHKKDARQYAFNKGRNVEIVGYPNADNFLFQKHTDVWRPQSTPKKRIIWAPHYTIFSGGYVTQSNFLWMSHFMLTVAQKYSDCIQFVFKPHPRLFSELCKHEEWGEEKVTAYYNEWSSMNNAQIETGEFVDLFMTSDAMIHDCGSFSIEYLYSHNPVIYIANDLEDQLAEMAEIGQLAMRQHYVGKTEEDIINFIEDVVLAGNDPMKQGREEFVKQYLLPPNGKTVAENTMDVLLKAFC